MGKNDTPKTPEKPTSQIKFGDRTVSNSYWNGNDYVTQYNPTDQEATSMNYLQSALPSAYASAADAANAQDYADRHYEYQAKEVNKAINPQLTSLKDSLITGGQVGSSTGWNKIKTLSDSYTDTMAELAANKETDALNYKNSLLGYANNLQGALGNFYNTGSGFAGNAASLQQQGWGQNKDTYSMELQNAQLKLQQQQAMYNNIMGGVKLAGSLALAPATGGATLTGLAGKTGGSL